MILREYSSEDNPHLVRLFRETVHRIAAKDYTEEQLEAWAPKIIEENAWCKVFSESYTIIMEEQGKIIGFANLIDSYFDRLFVHKDFQSKSVATALSEKIEKKAVETGKEVVTVHASITAKSFFEKRGYQVIEKQKVKKNHVELENFYMKKYLKKDEKKLANTDK